MEISWNIRNYMKHYNFCVGYQQVFWKMLINQIEHEIWRSPYLSEKPWMENLIINLWYNQYQRTALLLKRKVKVSNASNEVEIRYDSTRLGVLWRRVWLVYSSCICEFVSMFLKYLFFELCWPLNVLAYIQFL